jgi:hypothetical protein
MIHLNQLAIDYIWEKFQSSWIGLDSELTMNEVNRLQKGLDHKPFNPSSKAHIAFLSNLAKEIDALECKHPFMKF